MDWIPNSCLVAQSQSWPNSSRWQIDGYCPSVLLTHSLAFFIFSKSQGIFLDLKKQCFHQFQNIITCEMQLVPNLACWLRQNNSVKIKMFKKSSSLWQFIKFLLPAWNAFNLLSTFKISFTHYFPASTASQIFLLPPGQLKRLLAFIYLFTVILFHSSPSKSYPFFTYKLNPILQARLPILSPFHCARNSQSD